MLNTVERTQLTEIEAINAALDAGLVPHGEQTKARKQQIILCVRYYNRAYGIAPSLREITRSIGLSENSYASVGMWVNQLIDEGYLVRLGTARRSLRVAPRMSRRTYYTVPRQPVA